MNNLIFMNFSCEADPGALAKYVFALVKKDKTPDVLRQSMISQLEVFLQNGKFSSNSIGFGFTNFHKFVLETEPFVNLLFQTLESRDYLTPVIPSTNPPNPNVNTISVSPPKVVKELKKEIIPISELPNLTETANGNFNGKKDPVVEPKKDREVRKSDSVCLFIYYISFIFLHQFYNRKLYYSRFHALFLNLQIALKFNGHWQIVR